jgi:hypothetical protein
MYTGVFSAVGVLPRLDVIEQYQGHAKQHLAASTIDIRAPHR